VELVQGHLRLMATHYEKQGADDTLHRAEIQPNSRREWSHDCNNIRLSQVSIPRRCIALA
jgi:hypothetical protein